MKLSISPVEWRLRTVAPSKMELIVKGMNVEAMIKNLSRSPDSQAEWKSEEVDLLSVSKTDVTVSNGSFLKSEEEY